MSLFHKLQDMYFDAMHLQEELDRIQAQCDCHDADAHLDGSCCSSAPDSGIMRNTAERVGCLSHLHKLREDIHWFAKDLRNERQYLRPGEAPEEVERRIALIVNLIGYLGSTVDRIEESMTRFRAGCAQEALKRLKEKSADLEAHIQQMNRIL